jgi:fused signal recognition particle receptor
MGFKLFKDKNNNTNGSSGMLSHLKQGLSKTRKILTTDIDELFSGKKKIDDELLEDLEALLITADMGVETTMELMEKISQKAKKLSTADELKSALKEEILHLLQEATPPPPEIDGQKPFVIMVVGINGTGKTTTIGKLAAKFRADGKKTLIAASDTFRAAATEQLELWAERSGAEFVKGREKADPAAVAYDAVAAAIARNVDIVLIDTAGRLHTNVNLMEELKKIKRASSKIIAGSPHHVLLILDATTGQNALSQATLFNDAIGVTGIALTKLDGTAKGGIAISICNRLKIPLQFIGIGEKTEDLQEFDPNKFIDALF